MKKEDILYQQYLVVLKDNLLPAMGCTEPIALAYCAALARQTLGCMPEKVLLEISGNIIKNVKSVVVPHTGGMRGIAAAAAAGIVAGNADRQLEVIASVKDNQIEEIRSFLKTVPIIVGLAKTDEIFDITVILFAKDASAKVRIAGFHTNVVQVEKNGQVIHSDNAVDAIKQEKTEIPEFTVEKILDFANTADLEDVKNILKQQINYNMAIAEEGLNGNYGANIGSVLLASHGDVLAQNGESAVRLRARAMAAAGSDARMNGCEMPVIINYGSGNQGLAVSVPVIVYAKAMNTDEEKLYRALILSNLIAIHIKTSIGVLSAYCGAISAGAAAGCGIAYLKGASLAGIEHTLVNALAIDSGVICDGAKASCAAKIALAVDNGILGYEMYLQKQQFFGGDGIVKAGVENTIRSIGRLGNLGMAETDKVILEIMINE